MTAYRLAADLEILLISTAVIAGGARLAPTLAAIARCGGAIPRSCVEAMTANSLSANSALLFTNA